MRVYAFFSPDAPHGGLIPRSAPPLDPVARHGRHVAQGDGRWPVPDREQVEDPAQPPSVTKGEAAVAVEFDGLVKYADPHDGRSPAQVHWDEKRREDRVRDLDVRLVRMARADLGPSWPRVHARLAALLATPFVGPRRFTTVRRPIPTTRSA